MICSFCGTEIDESIAYQRIVGWERKRMQGGANQVTLRETRDEFACIHCIDKARHGLDPGQGSLL